MDLVSMGFLLVLSFLSSLPLAELISPALLLTPLINQNQTGEARNRSAVDPALFLNVSSHAGFLTVDPQRNSNTFFWYFPVQGQPVDRTPWIIWLQGGPGVSGLAGLFDEIGPFEYKDGGLKRRKYAWSNNHSMVFLDNPVGVGYSFTDKEDGYATNMEQYTNHLYTALQQFLTIFPELRKAPLFIAGESYAGRYVPALAARIEAASLLANQSTITLEGIILGNPVLNREDIVNITNAFYQWGLIDSEFVQYLKPLQDMYGKAVKEGNNELAVNLRDQLLDKLGDKSMQQQTYNLLADEDDYNKLDDFKNFLAKDDIKESLHVGDTIYHFRNSSVSSKLVPDFLTNSSAIVEELLNKYKLLIYCGQLDLTAPCVPSAEAHRSKWSWSKRDDFLNAPRVPWWYDETVAGYIKKGGNFEEALVRGAGHLAPMDKPAEVLVLVSSFIKNIEMELPPNYEVEKPYHQNTTIYSTIAPLNISTTVKPEVKTIEPLTKKVINATVKPEVATKDSLSSPTASNGSGVSAGTIASILFNIVLVIILALGAFLYYRLKKRNEDFFYSNVENNSDDLFLT